MDFDEIFGGVGHKIFRGDPDQYPDPGFLDLWYF